MEPRGAPERRLHQLRAAGGRIQVEPAVRRAAERAGEPPAPASGTLGPLVELARDPGLAAVVRELGPSRTDTKEGIRNSDWTSIISLARLDSDSDFFSRSRIDASCHTLPRPQRQPNAEFPRPRAH